MKARSHVALALYLVAGFGAITGAFLTVSVGGGVADRDALQKALESPELFALAKDPELGATVPDRLSFGPVALDGKATVAAFQRALPDDECRDRIAELLDAAYDRPDGFEGLDLRPFKRGLASFYDYFAEEYAEVVPVAEGRLAPRDIADFSRRDADTRVEEFARELGRVLGATVDGLPDTLVDPGLKIVGVGRTATGITLITVAGAAALWIVLALLRTGDPKARISWLGKTLAAPAAATLALGILFFSVRNDALRAALSAWGGGFLLPHAASGAGKALFDYFAGVVSVPAIRMIAFGAAGLAIGIATATLGPAVVARLAKEEAR